MKVGDLIFIDTESPLWLIVGVNRTKKVWHRRYLLYNPIYGIVEFPAPYLKRFQVLR